MKKLESELHQIKLIELNDDEYLSIEGGSEFSEGVVRTLGFIFRGAYEFMKGAQSGSQAGGGIFYK